MTVPPTSTPAAWRSAFLNLRPSVSPCPGLTGENWSAIHAKGVDFLDRWADEAAALGWTTLDRWGVHPEVGTVRVDFCGALVMGTGLVTAVTGQTITWPNATYHREKVDRPKGAVPLWAFGR